MPNLCCSYPHCNVIVIQNDNDTILQILCEEHQYEYNQRLLNAPPQERVYLPINQLPIQFQLDNEDNKALNEISLRYLFRQLYYIKNEFVEIRFNIVKNLSR